MVRYADDFVILCRSPEEAAAALAVVQAMDGASRPDAASGQDPDRGRAGRRASTSWAITSSAGRRWPRDEEPGEAQGHDPREDASGPTGRACKAIIADLNRTLRGWFEYFKHSHRTTFRTAGRLDPHAAAEHPAQTAGRRRGRGRGADHHRWPNAFFAEHGLFSLQRRPCCGSSILLEVRPPTGEPDAGDPPVRFGGRGTAHAVSLPLSEDHDRALE